jgi:hypothetical protein
MSLHEYRNKISMAISYYSFPTAVLLIQTVLKFGSLSTKSYIVFIGWGSLREKDHWGDPGVDGNIMLRWILWNWDLGVWTGLSWLRIETGVRHL